MANEKLISAEALLLSVRDDPEINSKHFARIKEHITHAPDAVKHGHWIRIYKAPSLGNVLECSECHVCGSPQWKVCPVCETRMDGENDA